MVDSVSPVEGRPLSQLVQRYYQTTCTVVCSTDYAAINSPFIIAKQLMLLVRGENEDGPDIYKFPSAKYRPPDVWDANYILSWLQWNFT